MGRRRARVEDSCWATTYMSRQVFPQAPSPTMTSLRRISAMVSRWTGAWRVRGRWSLEGVGRSLDVGER